MNVEWACFAQSLTDGPVKGMLSGPATILQWSCTRDDLLRKVICVSLGALRPVPVRRRGRHSLQRPGGGVNRNNTTRHRSGLAVG